MVKTNMVEVEMTMGTVTTMIRIRERIKMVLLLWGYIVVMTTEHIGMI